MDEPEYKISKEDILAMLKQLRHTAPEYATRTTRTTTYLY